MYTQGRDLIVSYFAFWLAGAEGERDGKKVGEREGEKERERKREREAAGNDQYYDNSSLSRFILPRPPPLPPSTLLVTYAERGTG